MRKKVEKKKVGKKKNETELPPPPPPRVRREVIDGQVVKVKRYPPPSDPRWGPRVTAMLKQKRRFVPKTPRG